MLACNAAWNKNKTFNESRGIFWEIGSSGMTLFNTVVPPSSKTYPSGAYRTTGGGFPNDATFSNASSQHAGGATVLPADGNVRFVKSSMSQYIWWSLGTRAGGEVVSASSS